MAISRTSSDGSSTLRSAASASSTSVGSMARNRQLQATAAATARRVGPARHHEPRRHHQRRHHGDHPRRRGTAPITTGPHAAKATAAHARGPPGTPFCL